MTDKDLFGKADGLMRRHALAPPATGSDTGAVPVLTDFIESPPAAPSPAASPATPDPHDLAAVVMAKVEERLAAEMERVRRELADTVAEALREALSRPPVK